MLRTQVTRVRLGRLAIPATLGHRLDRPDIPGPPEQRATPARQGTLEFDLVLACLRYAETSPDHGAPAPGRVFLIWRCATSQFRDDLFTLRGRVLAARPEVTPHFVTSALNDRLRQIMDHRT